MSWRQSREAYQISSRDAESFTFAGRIGMMLDAADLRLLTRWCADHSVHWQPLRTDADGARLLLEPAIARHVWQRMVLTADDAGFRLADEMGEALAAASDLPALLDALDGGVADRPSPWRTTADATVLAL